MNSNKYRTYLPQEHMVVLYDKENEIIDILVNYIVTNLENNNRCLYITGDTDTDLLLINLSELIDYGEYIAKGQLLILTKENSYSKDGIFNPDAMIQMLIKEVSNTVEDGYSGLAVSGEISWVLSIDDGFEKIMEYEWKLNERVFSKYPMSSVCRYNLTKFTDKMIKNIIQVHPFIIWKNKAHENPFYIPVEGFKENQLSKYQVSTWLENITKFTSIKSDFKTKLENQEQKLIESEEQYKYVFDNSPTAKSLTTPSGEIKVNNAFCQMLGYTKAELEGEFWEHVTHPDDIEISKRNINQLINGTVEKARFNKRYMHKNGTVVWTEVHTSLRKNSSGKPLYFITSIIDITEQKRLNEENRRLEMQLINQQKLEAIGTLASGVAHEINNPINGILNYGQLIIDSAGSQLEIQDYATEIVHETNRVATIVKNLLDFSKQSSQGHSYAYIEDIISKTLALINTIFKHDNIEINVHVDKNIPRLKCRSQQIQQVIMNLLTNARDSLNEKYPQSNENKKIEIQCKGIYKEGQNWISISVKDFGCGIDKEIIDKIYDPFFTTKPKEKGTGLGLSISYGIVADHHGTITVDSTEGEYSVFTLLLPCEYE